MRRMIASLTIAIVLTPVAAQAQQLCADRTTITDRLKTNYGESFTGGGVRNSESVFEVWMSEEKGTWTILMTMPNGKSCVMAAGTDWLDARPAMPAGIPG